MYYFTRIVFLEVTKIILEDKNKNDKLSVKSINNCIKKKKKKEEESFASFGASLRTGRIRSFVLTPVWFYT